MRRSLLVASIAVVVTVLLARVILDARLGRMGIRLATTGVLAVLAAGDWWCWGILLRTQRRHPEVPALREQLDRQAITAVAATLVTLVTANTAVRLVPPAVALVALVAVVILLSIPCLLFLVSFYRR